MKYLARQGLAFRGSGDDSESNFLQLLMLRANECPKLKVYGLEKKN